MFVPLLYCVVRYYCIAELVEQLEEQLERLRDDYHKICRVPVITSLDEETRIVSTSMKVCCRCLLVCGYLLMMCSPIFSL